MERNRPSIKRNANGIYVTVNNDVRQWRNSVLESKLSKMLQQEHGSFSNIRPTITCRVHDTFFNHLRLYHWILQNAKAKTKEEKAFDEGWRWGYDRIAKVNKWIKRWWKEWDAHVTVYWHRNTPIGSEMHKIYAPIDCGNEKACWGSTDSFTANKRS